MKTLKDNINEQLNESGMRRMRSEGPFDGSGNSQYMLISANQRNTGLYTCYNTYTGGIEIIETDDIESYMESNDWDEKAINNVTKLKDGQCLTYKEFIWTCLESCAL